jgi:hypothetical protein
MEDKAMEEEVSLAMKKYLHNNLGPFVLDVPTDVIDGRGRVVQEWDAAYKVEDILYLCEAKHVMSSYKVAEIPKRIDKFKKMFQAGAQRQLSEGISDVVGVACGTYIPPKVIQEAKDLGLICVYPSGYRHKVDKEPESFIVLK